jgi:hypothetical protein
MKDEIHPQMFAAYPLSFLPHPLTPRLASEIFLSSLAPRVFQQPGSTAR